MRISVVTVALNAVRFIDATIRSVTSQRASADVEYIVIDGGSTDGTRDVIRSYHEAIDLLIEERDSGQYDAIAKGLARASGDILCWLNGDDIYLPGALSTVGGIFEQWCDVRWICGRPTYINEAGQIIRTAAAVSIYPTAWIRRGWYHRARLGYLQQESMFWRRELYAAVGGLNTQFRLSADFDLWTRFAARAGLVSVASPLAAFRVLPGVQRSSVAAAEYAREAEQTACVERSFWPLLARLHPALPRAVAAVLMGRGAVAKWSWERRRWEIGQALRPVANWSWAELVGAGIRD